MQCCQSPATLILKLLITILIGLLASRYQSKRNWTESENALYWRIPAGGKLTFSKVYSRSQCCAPETVAIFHETVDSELVHIGGTASIEPAPVYQQWPFHQQCAAGHCWWWILSVLDNFNFLLREFYQSPLKNLETILDFSLFQHIHSGPLSNQHRRSNTLTI